MKYVQINVVPNSSTGKIMMEKHQRLLADGVDSYVFWGRRDFPQDKHAMRFTNPVSVALHYLYYYKTRTLKPWFSYFDTKRLLKKLDAIKPDVVHLHNIHGYVLNIQLLFKWLKSSECKIVWTLHDCWSFTGGCYYLHDNSCDKYQEVCCDCPYENLRLTKRGFDKARHNFLIKQELFCGIDPKRIELVCPSQWLADLVSKSYLKDYPVRVEYNTIDTKIFYPRASNFKEKHGLLEKFCVLGVALPFSERKGFDDFIKLRTLLPYDIHLVMVGLSKEQIEALPDSILGIERTDSKEELAEIYTACDLFFNPTKADNYPTTHLEAESCGTDVLSYDVGGCSEAMSRPGSQVVLDLNEAVSVITAHYDEWLKTRR